MIIDFLKTTSSKEKLTNALEVVREFKECESDAEYFMDAFVTWQKLETLEEFLAHLVEGVPLDNPMPATSVFDPVEYVIPERLKKLF